jgi:hypothetical protein
MAPKRKSRAPSTPSPSPPPRLLELQGYQAPVNSRESLITTWLTIAAQAPKVDTFVGLSLDLDPDDPCTAVRARSPEAQPLANEVQPCCYSADP